ncbi:hypothetical protein ACFPM0_32935 [Pseudonocardia sulfidoxydans]|uniref:hypothetical protein n=1 Tax=Pseudonocardia sulfidoxydans TaxID=54011 RepID=UPI00361BE398
MGAHQAGAAFVVDRPADLGARRRDRVALGGDEVQVVAAEGADDPRPHPAPQQHALVRRLAPATGVERRPVEHDPALRVDGHHRRGEVANARIDQVETVGVSVPGDVVGSHDRDPRTCPAELR